MLAKFLRGLCCASYAFSEFSTNENSYRGFFVDRTDADDTSCVLIYYGASEGLRLHFQNTATLCRRREAESRRMLQLILCADVLSYFLKEIKSNK